MSAAGAARRGVGVPLHFEVSVAPCAELEAQPELLASVLLLVQHMGLALDGAFTEPPLAPGEEATWEALALGDVPPAAATAVRAGPMGHASIVPARLLASARLCCVRSAAELGALPLARADAAPPLSTENERAALRLLRDACDQLRWEPAELRAALAPDEDSDEDPSAKRPRRPPPVATPRGELARRFALRRQRAVLLALADIDARIWET